MFLGAPKIKLGIKINLFIKSAKICTYVKVLFLASYIEQSN